MFKRKNEVEKENDPGIPSVIRRDNKKVKNFVGAVIFILLLLFGGYYYVDYQISKRRAAGGEQYAGDVKKTKDDPYLPNPDFLPDQAADKDKTQQDGLYFDENGRLITAAERAELERLAREKEERERLLKMGQNRRDLENQRSAEQRGLAVPSPVATGGQPQPIEVMRGSGSSGRAGKSGKEELDKRYTSALTDQKVTQRDNKNNEGSSERKYDEVGGSGLSSMLRPTVTASAKAATLEDRDFLLPKGALIDCGLYTRIVSTVAGMTKCTVTRNVYSENGKTLLIERGAEITGEYRSGMRQGQKRIFVLWDRIKTPEGVIANLNSPGTDPLGGSGLPGHVDTHFWERFGSAILLSLIEDAFDALSQRLSDRDVEFDNSTDTGEKMANEALKNSINIPPTLYKNQGERISIFVARDVDFRTVYQHVVSE